MILFFDTETTGLRDRYKPSFLPRVLQIGALLTDDNGKTLAELNMLLQPEGFTEVAEAASNVHGFSYDLVTKCGIDRQIGLDCFFQLVNIADELVAHNAAYDLDLMQIEIDYTKENADAGEYTAGSWEQVLSEVKKSCTMEDSRDVLKLPLSDRQAFYFHDKGIDQKYKNPRLIEAYNHFFNKDFEGAHDAMADVRACRDVYFALKKLNKSEA